MRKTLSALILVFTIGAIITLGGCQQTATPVPTPQTLAQKIIGKWTIKEAIGSYTINGVNRKDTTRFTAADYFEFKANGTVSIMETGKAYNGNWKITNDKLYFSNTNYMDYSAGFDLPTLTTNNLQLYYTESNSFSTLEQKLNLTK